MLTPAAQAALAGRAAHVFLPLPFWGRGPMETCYNICRHWPGLGLPTQVRTALAGRDDPGRLLAPAVPRALPRVLGARLMARPGLAAWLMRRAEARGLAQVRPGDLCYFWPGASLPAMRAARQRGGVVVVEFINTHVAWAQAVLAAECARIGAPAYDHITPAALDEEAARLELADFVFSPGPLVGPSIRQCWPGAVRILETSYGAPVPSVLAPRPDAVPGAPVRFLFVGTAGIRKGVHLLLEAWRARDFAGELVIAGGVEPWLAGRLAGLEDRSVRLTGFVSDVAALYAGADVFVFPSLEEGGPQVTYEAAAHGLPLVVTEVGGGRIAADGRNALVVPPGDAMALRAAMARLAGDAALRARLGAAARADAPRFDWPVVARERLELLAAALAEGKGAGA